jgi:TadE-like protein
MSGRARNHQRSQALVEFAIVAPLLLLFFFATIDFGRVIYAYVTVNQAVNEGARVAIRASAQLPTNADVQSAVRRHAVDLTLATPCPNGPITDDVPPPNQGWIYITQPDPPSTPEALSPALQNAPGGEPWAVGSGSCSAINSAHDHAPLQVTIRFNFAPFTPLIGELAGHSIIITAAAVYSTEY